MAKTIMISDTVYKTLSKMKRSKESFTQLLSRLSESSGKQKGSILECAGLWSHLSDKEIKELHDSVKKSRASWRKPQW